MFRKAEILLISATALVAISMASPVHAQDFDEDDENDIVVTAQKRDESSQDVSVSLAVFSGDSLNKYGVDDTAGISSLTSGVVISNTVGGSVPTITIRGQGVGTASFFANQPNSAAINVDGVYLPSAIMSNFQIFDTERVEILKGPQGTLYGRNTTAGAINFYSRKPTFEAEGYVQGSLASWNTVRLMTGVGGPISDRFAYRASFVYDHSDGNVINTYSNPALDIGPRRTNGIERFAGRAQLLFRSDRGTEVLLNVHGGSDRSDNFHYQVMPAQRAGYIDPTWGTPDLFALSPECLNQYRPTAPACLTGTQDIAAVDTDGDNYRVNSNLDVPSRIDAIGGSLQIEHDIGSVTFNSITAFDKFTRRYYEDEDGGPLSELHVYFDENFRHYSQEFRLTSATDSRFQWIMGAFGSRLSAEMRRQADYTGATNVLLAMGVPWNGIVYANNLKESSLAGFAHSTYDVSSKIRLLAGLRFNYEKKEITVLNANIIGHSPLFAPINPQNYTIVSYRTNNVTKSDSWTNLSGKVGAEFRPSDDVLLYAHASRGFKSGGFPGSLGVTPGRLQPYRPEITDNFEIGAKTNFDGNRGLLNVAAFFTHSKDRLEFATSEDVSFTDFTNAASSEIKGIEVQASYRFPGELVVDMSAAYIAGKYKEFVDRGSGIVYSGNQLPFSPRYTANAQLSKHIALGEEDGIDFSTNFSYASRQYFTADNILAFSAKGYGVWNGRLAYRLGAKGLTAAVFVKNILDSEYRVGGSSGVTGNAIASYGLKRSLGMELKYDW